MISGPKTKELGTNIITTDYDANFYIIGNACLMLTISNQTIARLLVFFIGYHTKFSH